MNENVQAVLHTIGDGQGRARLRPDTSARPTYAPAGLLLSTAETSVDEVMAMTATASRQLPYRVAICFRVSSEEQVEGYSLDLQLRAARAYCAERGWDRSSPSSSRKAGAPATTT
jgi:hypothetical protein